MVSGKVRQERQKAIKNFRVYTTFLPFVALGGLGVLAVKLDFVGDFNCFEGPFSDQED
jgi:hypothetical protein